MFPVEIGLNPIETEEGLFILDFDRVLDVVRSIIEYWFTVVVLPPASPGK